MLETAAAAAAEIGARGLHPVGRRLLHRLDEAAAETRAGLDQPYPHGVPGDAPRHEHHIAIGAADALPPEREVVDGHGQSIAASGSRHVALTIRVRGIGVNLPSPLRSSRARTGQVSLNPG